MNWLKSPSPKLLRFVASLILVVVAVGMVWGVHKMRDLNTHYSMSQFMPKDHPLYSSDRLIKKTFRLNEREPVIVNVIINDGAKGTWLEKGRIDVLDRATTALKGVANIKNVLSLSNVEMANNTPTGIQVDRLLGMVEAKDWKKRVLNDPLLTPGLISKDGRVTTLVADIPNLSEIEMNELMKSIRDDVGKVVATGDAKLLVSGVLPLQTQMTTLLSQELVNFFGLAFLVCVITLLAYFRSYSTVFVCLLLVIIANIATFTSLAVLGIPFTVLSSALPIMCSIEALAIGSHTLLIFGENYRHAMTQENPPSKARLVYTTYKALLFPNFLMSTTTIIGFATLISSQVPLIRQFSQSVSAGIMMSCICMSIALPSLMYLFPIPVARSWTGAKARWALWVMHHRRMVVFTCFAAVALLVANGVRLNWAVQLYDDLPKINDIKTSADLIDKQLGGMIPLEVMIKKEDEESPWNDPARMNKLASVLKKWRNDASIGSAVGLPDLLNTGIQTLDSRKAIAETLFLYGFSGADNPTTHFLSTDGASTRLSFRMKDVNADQMGGVIKKIEADVKEAFPGFEVHAGGMAAMVHPLNAELSQDLIYGLWHSLLLISVLLVLVFRSFRLAFIAAVPNLLPPFALLAMMAYFKTPIKPVVAIIFSIALGLAYNNTVFLLTRLKKFQTRFTGAREVIMRAFYQEGNPCLFSSLAVLGGFAVFLASYFSPNRTFGAYMLLSIGVGLIGDLILLPALLRMFPWFVFPGEVEPVRRVAVATGSWSKNIVVTFALFAGMGPSAAAAAQLVKTPFVISMKKAAFAQLVLDGAVAKAVLGEKTRDVPVRDIVISDPLDVQVTGIAVNLKYSFEAPANTAKPGEWNLASRKISALLNVAHIEAHKVVKVIRGEDTIEVHLDGTCDNVQMALPEGSTKVSGRLVLGQKNGAPRMELQDFTADWAPNSWQVVTMNCQSPSPDFAPAMANAAREQLRKITPFLGSIAESIQAELDQNLSEQITKTVVLGNPLQEGQTLELGNFKATINGNDTVVRGNANFHFVAAQAGCGATIPSFAAQPKIVAGESAMFVPFDAMKQLLICAHSDGSMKFDTDSAKFLAFNELMHSGFKKSAVWPDLNNFSEDTLMKFHGVTAAAPELTGEKTTGAHSFSVRLTQKMNLLMTAPKDGRYVPYTSVAATFTGPVSITIANNKVVMKPDASGRLSMNGGFVKSYVDAYHPEGSIDWSKLTPAAQDGLLKEGWSFDLPTWGVSPRVLVKIVDGDLQGANFRMGFQVIRR